MKNVGFIVNFIQTFFPSHLHENEHKSQSSLESRLTSMVNKSVAIKTLKCLVAYSIQPHMQRMNGIKKDFLISKAGRG